MTSPRALGRIAVNVLADGALAAAAAPVARYLADPSGGLFHPLWFLSGGVITLLLGGLPFRLSQQYWRFAGLSDLAGVVGSSIATASLFTLLLVASGYPVPTPTFPAIHALTLMVFLGAPRVGYRFWHGRGRGDAHADTILIVGAGEGADAFVRANDADRQARRRILGFLALTDRQTGRRMHGRPILGTVEQAEEVLARLARRGTPPGALVVAEPDFLGAPLRRLMEAAAALALPVQRAPRATALTPADALTLKPVAIEDLLNRPQVRLDMAGLARLIAGRRVAVTGAGGSIGSELARQIAALGPACLAMIDSSEFALWQIDLELGESFAAVPREAMIGDVRDAARMRALFAALRPETVFHAAALKHVPMVEANPREGLLTNAVGTRVVADAARDSGAGCFVLVSTDKAVNPTSLMGASKRLAEMYAQSLNLRAGADGTMRCVTVRFGNVLGSTGSVVPLFARQLARGGPLTVTHPAMQRYFMTVSEAVSLVLQAAVAGVEGDTGEGIFVLDMGDPIRIVDLARQMIRLAGLRPEIDVAIEFTGLRPGEKLLEELFHGREKPVPTGHPGLLMARPRAVDERIVARALDQIEEACRAGQIEAALDAVHRLVPEYERPATPPRAASAG